MSDWYRIEGDRLTLTLHIQPGAKTTQAAGAHGESLKIKVAAPPVDGQANARLVEFLKKMFDVPSCQICIKRGNSGRKKVVEILGSVRHPLVLLDNDRPENRSKA